MKKYIVLVLILLVGSLLTAATIIPPPVVKLSGTLQYSPNNTCMLPDYVEPTVMGRVYLVGNGLPSAGQYQGCWIQAAGYYSKIGGCVVFKISSSKISCANVIDPTPEPSVSASLR